MYVVTNREMLDGAQGLAVFGKRPNAEGPNELRIAEVRRLRTGGHRVRVLRDQLTRAEVRRIERKWQLSLGGEGCASLKVACDSIERARRTGRHLLLYVHGYNNDMADVIAGAEALEALYPVVVIPFSWPANGGGKLSGTAAYAIDKQDARASADALNRFIDKVAGYHALITARQRAQLAAEAEALHPDNPLACQAAYARLLEARCQTRLTLMCHSMGNYVLKYATLPSGGASRKLVFDNIALVAADCNNPGHREWVERLNARRRVYIAINEEDYALRWSRIKPGEAQRERLGHYLKGLNASNADYIDFTAAEGVGKSHSYFLNGEMPIAPEVRAVFAALFSGQSAESCLAYRPELNCWRPQSGDGHVSA